MELLREFPIGGRCWRVAMTPDGQRLAIASYFDLQVWAAEGTAPLWAQHFPEPRGMYPASLAFSPDGATLAMGHNHALRLYDADTGKARLSCEVGVHGDRALYTRDGGRLLLAGKQIAVLDAPTGQPLQVPLAGARSFTGISLDAAEATLAAVGDKSLWIFDLEQGALRFRYPVARFGTHGAALSPDGSVAWVTQAGDTALAVGIGKKAKKILAEATVEGGLTEVIAHPQWAWVLLASNTHLSLHDPRSGALITRSPAAERVDDLALSADGRLLLSAHLDGTARLWQLPLP